MKYMELLSEMQLDWKYRMTRETVIRVIFISTFGQNNSKQSLRDTLWELQLITYVLRAYRNVITSLLLATAASFENILRAFYNKQHANFCSAFSLRIFVSRSPKKNSSAYLL